MSVTRRSVLLGGVAAAGIVTLAGCDDDDAAPVSRLGPADRNALAAAIDAEQQIVAAYATRPDNGLATDIAHRQHLAHLAALESLHAGPAPSASPSGGPGGDAAGPADLQAAAVAVGDGSLAAVLASIAASHLTPPPVEVESEFLGDES